MEKMGFGILGAARIAASALIPAIHKSANARPLAVAARDHRRATEYAAQHGIPKTYGSYEEMLADPEVEAVYNPLPNSLHLPWTLRALEGGKHVLCKKPSALNAAGAEQMDQAAKRAGRTLMEAFMYHFHPQIARALELVRSGTLGELRLWAGGLFTTWAATASRSRGFSPGGNRWLRTGGATSPPPIIPEAVGWITASWGCWTSGKGCARYLTAPLPSPCVNRSSW
jgi:predicted dehydrogenase